MRPADLVTMALSNLARRKGRTLLTLAGVVIGVAAVVLLVSLGIGVKLEILKTFQNEDELRVLRVSRSGNGAKGKDDGGLSLFGMSGGRLPISSEDLEALGKVPGVASVVPHLNLLMKVSLGEEDDEAPPVAIAAAPASEADRLGRLLLHGRMWTPSESRPCLLPSTVAEVLGARDSPLGDLVGRTIVFSRNRADDPAEPRTFTVVGILDSSRMGVRGGQVLLPWEPAIALRELTRGGLIPFGYEKDRYLTAEVQAASPGEVEELKKRLRNLNYQVITTADIIGMINTVFMVVEGFMGCVGAIGLIVALFGIANTMAMSVLERTREIGVMKAVGARTRDIRRIFLVEAVAIGLIGGLAGLAAGWIGAGILSIAARTLMTDMPSTMRLFHVSGALAAGAVLFSMLVSMVAGWIPARRAAAMPPVQALRYE